MVHRDEVLLVGVLGKGVNVHQILPMHAKYAIIVAALYGLWVGILFTFGSSTAVCTCSSGRLLHSFLRVLIFIWGLGINGCRAHNGIILCDRNRRISTTYLLHIVEIGVQVVSHRRCPFLTV
jgi:hypothetical protein